MKFALELYLRHEPGSQSELTERARSAARKLGGDEMAVTFLRSIYLLGDEICFLIFDAPSAEAVAAAAAEAGITFERVVEAELLPDNSAAYSACSNTSFTCPVRGPSEED